MEQQIGFCTNANGGRIAYATLGKGPALVMTATWLSHLQLTWQDPEARRFFERLAAHHTLVRYDQRGSGLSDRKRTDFTLEAEVNDLETTIDHLKLKRVALLGSSCGGPTAIAYTVRHPRQVSHLILYGTYANGKEIATEAVKTAFTSLVRAHWGIGSKTIADLFFPGASSSIIELFAKFQRESATPEIAVEILELVYKADVASLCPSLRIPTLVLHRQEEKAITFKMGRELASLIPNARFCPLEGNLHIPWYGDSEPILRAIAEFLGDPVTISQAASESSVAVDDSIAHEARAFIAGLDWVALSRYRIVGDYTRYDETVRNTLKDVRHKIAGGFDRPSQKRENYLIWAAPGSGKTYFVQQVAVSLPPAVRYQECNLAKCSREQLLKTLAQLDAKNKSCLCLIDEVDAKPDEAWPYETLLPYLDASAERKTQFVFVLAGSSGSSLVDMKKQMASRSKGADLLTRIPAGNEYEIPQMNLGDRVLIALSQFRQAGKETGREIQAVEKLGLYYIALNSRLSNTRQLHELAVRTVERLSGSEDRVKYDNLFGAGDPENKAFWMQSLPAAADLANRFVTLED
ncbi:MAG: alpha/beta hydrolase [Dehalococcoidia bacterium]|nr:alpha/beta hydrolase [Dehalococcoidia bacterium]